MNYQYNFYNELVIDNFAGGGGASTGIELAIGRPVDVAINHDPDAIAMHKVNHPFTRHYCEDVWTVNPKEVTQGRPVALCWFSPDCKHFSKAKGGKPVEKKIRGLAWVAVKWAASVQPRVIILENVEEFKTWGRIGEDGKPDPNHKGETFLSFVKALEKLGYNVKWKELRACDYGAPTIRKRFFLIARRDGQPIVFPKPTHGKGLKPYHTAAECIDWSIPCKSIFNRAKPLAEATMRRIARGIKKFVLDNPKPFIVQFNYDNPPQDIDKPLTTLTAVGHHYLVAPTLVQMGYGEAPGQTSRALDLHKPIGTITAGGNKFALVSAFISRQFGTSIGHELTQPLGTVTGIDKSRLVTAFLMKYYGGKNDGQSLAEPLHTVRTKDCFCLVTVDGIDYAIADIKMRMLEPHELFAAQGFPKDYKIAIDCNGKAYSKAKQIASCGNAVCPAMAESLVRANLPELAYKTKIQTMQQLDSVVCG